MPKPKPVDLSSRLGSGADLFGSPDNQVSPRRRQPDEGGRSTRRRSEQERGGGSGGERRPPGRTRQIAVSADDPDSWESTHERWTFHCPTVLREAVGAEAKRIGVSQSAYIVDALYHHLDRTRAEQP